MYEIKQTLGIKAKKFSIWLGLDEIVRSLSKVKALSLLEHLNKTNQEDTQNDIQQHLPSKQQQPSSESNVNSRSEEKQSTIRVREYSPDGQDNLFLENLSKARARAAEARARAAEARAKRDSALNEVFRGLNELRGLESTARQVILDSQTTESQTRRIEPRTIDVEKIEL